MPKKGVLILFLFCFIVLNFSSGLAQRTSFVLKGKVIDAESRKPLVGATLSFDFGNKGTSTDSSGNYKIIIPSGEWSLKISFIGYKPTRQKITISSNLTKDFEMASMNSTLDEVVVSGTARKQTENTSIGLNSLNIKGVKKLPAVMGEVDILRSLQTLPGITSVGEGSNGVNVRGGNVDQNLIYVDDTPIFNPTHLFGLFSVFPADAIRGIELYKGGIPAQFGGRTSSVMDIKMTEPNSEQFKMTGGIGVVSERIMMEIPVIKDKLSVLVAGRASYNDFWLNTFGGSSLAGTKANFYDFASKIFYKPNNKTTISFSSYLNNDNYLVDSLFSINNIVARTTRFQYGHQNFSLKFSRYVNNKFSYNVTGAMSDYSARTYSNDSTNNFELDTKVLYKSLKLNFDYFLSDKHKLNFGFSGVRYDISPGALNKDIISNISPTIIPNEQSYELALFASDEFTISKKWSAEYGLRVVEFMNMGPTTVRNYLSTEPLSVITLTSTSPIAAGSTESTYMGIEPRIAFKYDMGNENAIKFGYNRMNQFIQLVSNNTTPLPTSRWKISDRYVKPQTSDFFTAGYFKNFRDDVWEASAEVYYKRTNNLLDYVSGANLQLNDKIETQLLEGKGKAYGLELMLTKKKGETTGWLSYTYARAFEQVLGSFPQLQQLNEGKWFSTDYDKPHTINFMMTSQVGVHHSFSWNWTYSTGRPFTAPVGVLQEGLTKYPIYIERNNARISDYHRLDFSWIISNPTLRQRRWEGNWVFTVYNLYSRQNAYSYFFKPAPYGLVPYKLSVFSQPFLSLAYNFKFK